MTEHEREAERTSGEEAREGEEMQDLEPSEEQASDVTGGRIKFRQADDS